MKACLDKHQFRQAITKMRSRQRSDNLDFNSKTLDSANTFGKPKFTALSTQNEGYLSQDCLDQGIIKSDKENFNDEIDHELVSKLDIMTKKQSLANPLDNNEKKFKAQSLYAQLSTLRM